MALIQVLRRQRQADLCEFKAYLVYGVSSRTAIIVKQRNPLKKEKEEKRQRKEERRKKKSKVISKQASQ